MAWFFSLVLVGFLLGLLWAEYTENLLLRYVCKPLASAAFVTLGMLAYDSAHTYSQWIVLGLLLGAGGDVALMFRSSQSFLLGLVSFLLGHIAYVVAFACLVRVHNWFEPLALAPLAAAALVLAYLWPHLGKMRVPVIAYVLAIVLMVVGALAVYRASPGVLPESPARLVAIGALLFFASDVSVAKGRFVRARVVDKLWGLPAYYIGQLCIAWSLY